MHAQFAQNVLRVGQHVHQMADRRALVSGDIADAVFQQCLGDRQNAFAPEGLAFAQPQTFDFLRVPGFMSPYFMISRERYMDFEVEWLDSMGEPREATSSFCGFRTRK